MGILTSMQDRHYEWQTRNFGKAATAENSFLGMVEEMGELAHAMLKHKQGIRGMADDGAALEKIIDAHCDWIIFSFGLANEMGYDLEEHLERTFEQVMKRDWVADPERGGQG